MIEMSKQNNNPINKLSQFFNMYVDTQIQIQVEFSYTLVVVNTILSDIKGISLDLFQIGISNNF